MWVVGIKLQKKSKVYVKLLKSKMEWNDLVLEKLIDLLNEMDYDYRYNDKKFTISESDLEILESAIKLLKSEGDNY